MNKILKYYFLFSISILFTQEINDIKSVIIAENLNRPVFAVFEPATNKMYAVEQTGKIYLINNLQNKSLFLDLSKKISVSVTPDERGLLGMVFDPNFQSNGFFYVSYIDTENYSVVSRFRLSENKDEVDIESEKKLIYFEQPFNNHNGSHLDFNPIDNYLYISFGDGGASGDPYGNAQNLHNFFGSILRIDPQDDGSYLIPNDNPLVLHKKNNDSDIKSEIWAYGLRNVWRFSFDNNNGDIYMGDVGQYLWEEINYLEFGENGGNFGWNIMEGNHCYPEPGCDKEGFINPIFEYPSDANYPFSLMGIKQENVSGCSVTGGYIYRGDQIKSLYGLYIFSDFCTGKIWALDPLKNIVQEITEPLLGSEKHMISSFSQDINNEIYIVEFSGKIYKIEPHHE
jgi:glucose/arabinose dehydrogenase